MRRCSSSWSAAAAEGSAPFGSRPLAVGTDGRCAGLTGNSGGHLGIVLSRDRRGNETPETGASVRWAWHPSVAPTSVDPRLLARSSRRASICCRVSSRRYHARTFGPRANFLPEPSFSRGRPPRRWREPDHIVKGCSDVGANPFSLARGGYPDVLVQPGGRPAEATTAGPPSGHAPADRAGRSGAPLPDGGHRPGSLHRALHPDPGGGARRLPALAADAALPGAPAGAGARPARERAHLLQVRGGQSRRLAQAEHRGAAGVLRQAGGREAHRHRNRRRVSGAAPWRWRAPCSVSRSRSTWSRSPTRRSRTGER